MRCGDLNPVRAGLVRSPKDCAWSSHRYAFGEPNPLSVTASVHGR
jgi:putative transposase